MKHKALAITMSWTVLLTLPYSASANDKTKLALVVGVNTYGSGADLADSEYAVNDAGALSQCLRSAGFTVTELLQTDDQQPMHENSSPTLENIKRELGHACDSMQSPGVDVIVVSLHGRWVTLNDVGESGKNTASMFFCPSTASIQGLKTTKDVTSGNELLALDEIYELLSQ